MFEDVLLAVVRENKSKIKTNQKSSIMISNLNLKHI